MDEFAKPSWWISVVVAGLLVNLASAYLKPRVDRALLRGSSWWRSRSAARIAERDARVADMARNDRRMAFACTFLIVDLIHAAIYTAAAILVSIETDDSEALRPWWWLLQIMFFVPLVLACVRASSATDAHADIAAAEWRRRQDTNTAS